MYTSFFQIKERPFQINTDPKYLWLGEDHKEALAVLKYGVLSDNGFLVLTGDVGTGKTTLIKAWLQELDDNILIAHVTDPDLDLIGFLNHVARSLNVPGQFQRKEDFLFSFREFLLQTGSDRNRRILLVIDEAHKLSLGLLEQVRLLSNIELPERKLINIFLVGQNELNEKLMSPGCRALRQRITLHYNIKPLSKIETQQYITHRLKIAGTDAKLFGRGAIHEIHRLSGGYPRLINILCDRALLAGYINREKKISTGVLLECGKEILLPGETIADLFPNPRVQSSKIPMVPAVGPGLLQDARSKLRLLLNWRIPERLKAGFDRAFSAMKWRSSFTSLPWFGSGKRRLLIYGGLAILLIGLVLSFIPLTNSFGPSAPDRNAGVLRDPPAKNLTADVSKENPVSTNQNDNGSEGVSKKTLIDTERVDSPFSGEIADKTAAASVTDSISSRVAPDPEPIRVSPVEKARELLMKEEFGSAIALLSNLMESRDGYQPETKKLYVQALRGEAALLKGRDKPQAAKLLQKVIETDPMDYSAHYELGKLYAAEKNYNQSIASYTKAAELNPNSTTILFNLGFSYAAVQNYSRAEEAFSRASASKPAYLDKVLVNLAVVQFKQGKEKECINNLRRALTVNPNNQKAKSYLDRITAERGAPQ